LIPRVASPVDIITVGVLSDTHGHLYPEVMRALEGVDHIVHAGDVGSPQVVAALRAIAPLTAVRGNCDYDTWAQELPTYAEIELEGVRMLVGHIESQLRPRVEAAARDGDMGGYAVVITGHSHLAAMETRESTLYLNPGSAGPRRFSRPRTIARLTIRPSQTEGAAGLPRPDGSNGRARVDAEIVIVDG